MNWYELPAEELGANPISAEDAVVEQLANNDEENR